MVLFKMALCPAVILLLFVYAKDKYEKEPVKTYLTAVIMGFVSIGVVLGFDLWLMRDFYGIKAAIYNSFVTSALTEEGVKYLFLFLLTFKNPNLNKPMDGIVYAAAVSLGFAAAENLIYVLDPLKGGFSTAVMRSVFSVPGHCVFGIAMGVFYERAVLLGKRADYFYAFAIPFLMHGIYNFILLGYSFFSVFFIPYVIYLYMFGIRSLERRIKKQTS